MMKCEKLWADSILFLTPIMKISIICITLFIASRYGEIKFLSNYINISSVYMKLVWWIDFFLCFFFQHHQIVTEIIDHLRMFYQPRSLWAINQSLHQDWNSISVYLDSKWIIHSVLLTLEQSRTSEKRHSLIFYWW